jgi:Holliday junction resolvase RusA-like endonuclease
VNWADLFIVLPLPPSNNDLVRPCQVRGKVRLVSTQEATTFRTQAVHILKNAAKVHHHPALLTGPVMIHAVFYVATLASDCNNRWKALEDAITESGVVWDDDRQVSRGVSDKEFTAPGEEPWCQVRIEPRNSEDHARRLTSAAGRKPVKRLPLASPNFISPRTS